MKTSEELLRLVCREVMDDVYPDGDTTLAPGVIQDQMFELQKLSLALQTFVLDIREKGGRSAPLWYSLYQVVR